jgi:hypothetical protein
LPINNTSGLGWGYFNGFVVAVPIGILAPVRLSPTMLHTVPGHVAANDTNRDQRSRLYEHAFFARG